jgi:hypothetical protein
MKKGKQGVGLPACPWWLTHRRRVSNRIFLVSPAIHRGAPGKASSKQNRFQRFTISCSRWETVENGLEIQSILTPGINSGADEKKYTKTQPKLYLL